MKSFKIIKRSTYWSTTKLIEEIKALLPQMEAKGYEIVSVSFGTNLWYTPTAYITISKEE